MSAEDSFSSTTSDVLTTKTNVWLPKHRNTHGIDVEILYPYDDSPINGTNLSKSVNEAHNLLKQETDVILARNAKLEALNQKLYHKVKYLTYTHGKCTRCCQRKSNKEKPRNDYLSVAVYNDSFCEEYGHIDAISELNDIEREELAQRLSDLEEKYEMLDEEYNRYLELNEQYEIEIRRLRAYNNEFKYHMDKK